MNIYKLTNQNSVTRRIDGADIPIEPTNSDYQQFLKDQAAGAIVLPVDIPNPNDAINARIIQIESATQVPRIVRESLMRAEERAAIQDATSTNTAAMILSANFGYQKVKSVDDQVRALRAQIK